MPVRFAIIGCGRIAARHAEHITTVAHLVAACDVDIERAATLCAPSHARAFDSAREMLTQLAGHIDVVSLCTPNGLHCEHALAAFEAGCHVLCEKPMALSTADCGLMINAAERANRRLFVVKQNRFNPPVAALKRAIEDGRLGRILSVALNCYWNRNPDYYANDPWKGTLELDGGCLFTQFSHFIDLLYWLVGDIRDVAAFTDNAMHRDMIEFEDHGVVALRFANGALGTIHFTINSHEKNMEGSLTVFGERGTVKIGGQYLNELEYQNIKGFRIEGLPSGRPPNQYGHYVGSMSNHEEVYRNVVDVLTQGGVIATHGYEGLKTVEIIERIYESAKWASSDMERRSATSRSVTA